MSLTETCLLNRVTRVLQLFGGKATDQGVALLDGGDGVNVVVEVLHRVIEVHVNFSSTPVVQSKIDLSNRLAVI